MNVVSMESGAMCACAVPSGPNVLWFRRTLLSPDQKFVHLSQQCDVVLRKAAHDPRFSLAFSHEMLRNTCMLEAADTKSQDTAMKECKHRALSVQFAVPPHRKNN